LKELEQRIASFLAKETRRRESRSPGSVTKTPLKRRLRRLKCGKRVQEHISLEFVTLDLRAALD